MNVGRCTRYLPVAVFAIALALALPMLKPLPESAARSVTPSTAATPTTIAQSNMERLFLPNPAASAHSVSLADLGGSHIAAAWFAGSREGAPDVDIVFATFDGKAWSQTRPIMTRARVQNDTGRRVGKLGNPVLWRDTAGRLHLWFVSVGYGGWACSAINHSLSDDDGITWSPARRLITSPFFNISTLVRSAPILLADGGVALPVYHELAAKRPEWLRLDARGQIVDKQRIPASVGLLQPSAVAFDAHDIIVLMRDASRKHRVHATRSTDGGARWTHAVATDLPNPDASVALLHLADGRLLLASNPDEHGRGQLALQVSSDRGQSWSPPQFVERGADEKNKGYSYPALFQDENSIVHLAYTWRREAIVHLRFAPAELGVIQ
ncbi:MAG: exo-alpha-sialidase [Betaproteobacteria bacterium]|nr:exo-alpha-sialidase [Betaproteobacteria bacterium]